jgi:outer membrane protein OmpA-like peptidoglycan-associated protein
MAGPLSFEFQLVVYHRDGTIRRAAPVVIPVRSVEDYLLGSRTIDGATIDRFSLLLFPFNDATLDAVNMECIDRYIVPSIREALQAGRANVQVAGYANRSERTGNVLSKRRAQHVVERIKSQTEFGPQTKLDIEGRGNEDLLYVDTVSEARCYNRTVAIEVIFWNNDD